MEDTTKVLISGAAIGLFVGFMFGLMVATTDMEKLAAKTDCAYYDPETAKFTWGSPTISK